jgi:hypothetical protein
LLSRDPDRLWRITLRLFEQAPDDAALAYVAAGPLEDLLASHGSTFIHCVEEMARKHARFLLALSGVYGQTRFKPEIYARIQSIIRA